MPHPFAPVAVATRNGLAESWHGGAAAVVTPSGRLAASLGDPGLSTFVRSAAKPFQCLPLLLAGGAERFALSAADVALICASHGGTPAHAERAASLLRRGGFSVDDLLCGAHPPFDRESARRLRAAGEAPTPLHNNCSGKHAGMLLACRLLDLPTADYVDPGHPLQVRIRELVALCSNLQPREVGVGIDGCSVPAFHLPLAATARAYAALAAPELSGLPRDVAVALGRTREAMATEPGMVAGPGRFTTRLIAATGGRILGKEGAEGFYGLAVRAPSPLGIALKIADGGERCRDGVVVDLLRQLGALSADEQATLADLVSPELKNVRGKVVGRIVPDLRLDLVANDAPPAPSLSNAPPALSTPEEAL